MATPASALSPNSLVLTQVTLAPPARTMYVAAETISNSSPLKAFIQRIQACILAIIVRISNLFNSRRSEQSVQEIPRSLTPLKQEEPALEKEVLAETVLTDASNGLSQAPPSASAEQLPLSEEAPSAILSDVFQAEVKSDAISTSTTPELKDLPKGTIRVRKTRMIPVTKTRQVPVTTQVPVSFDMESDPFCQLHETLTDKQKNAVQSIVEAKASAMSVLRNGLGLVGLHPLVAIIFVFSRQSLIDGCMHIWASKKTDIIKLFDSYDDFPTYLPGFCFQMGLNPATALDLVQKKQWDAFLNLLVAVKSGKEPMFQQMTTKTTLVTEGYEEQVEEAYYEEVTVIQEPAQETLEASDDSLAATFALLFAESIVVEASTPTVIPSASIEELVTDADLVAASSNELASTPALTESSASASTDLEEPVAPTILNPEQLEALEKLFKNPTTVWMTSRNELKTLQTTCPDAIIKAIRADSSLARALKNKPFALIKSLSTLLHQASLQNSKTSAVKSQKEWQQFLEQEFGVASNSPKFTMPKFAIRRPIVA